MGTRFINNVRQFVDKFSSSSGEADTSSMFSATAYTVENTALPFNLLTPGLTLMLALTLSK